MDSLLLHTCCAPCSVAVIDELKNDYDLTVFFYNPNIHPQEEYDKRKKEVIKVCKKWGIKMVDGDYEVDKWRENIAGLEKEPEGGARCFKCFAHRLDKAAAYAKEHSFKIFATTLTSGRNKLADIIHPIAENMAKKYHLKFLDEDWKKGGRQERGQKMVKDMDIYRQDYCGCTYSNSKIK